MTSAVLTALAFAAFNLLRLASYFPQIVAVAQDRHGATAISFSCWSIWIGANGSTALYAWINLSDWTLAVISAFNAACCATVLLLAGYKWLLFRQRLPISRSEVLPHAGVHWERYMADHEHWQLDGSAPELYERYLVPTITSVWAADLVDRAMIASGERVLDVACGTGVVARLVADRIRPGRVVGLDYNPGMLAVARSVSRSSASLEWLEGSVLCLPFNEASFNLVLCQLGLQFFADRPLAVREMRRVLVPWGRLALSVYGPIEHTPAAYAFAEALDQCLGPSASKTKRAEHIFTQAGEVHTLLTDAGFEGVDVSIVTKWITFPSLLDYVRFQLIATPMSGLLADRSEAERDGTMRAIASHVRSLLDPTLLDGDRLSFPQEAFVATAIRAS